MAIISASKKVSFYSFDLDTKQSEYLEEGPNCIDLWRFSYCAAEDIVVAFVMDEKVGKHDFFKLNHFLKTPKS